MTQKKPKNAATSQDAPAAVEEVQAGYRQSFVRVGANEYHIVEAGPISGLPVILLHGFPEFWWSWRNQMPVLAEAGFRVVAVDMRGYGLSDAPEGISSYRLGRLVDDVIGIADDLGLPQFGLVGHDWGGIVAWAVAAYHPHRVSTLVVLDAPHLDVMPDVLWRRPSQILRSAYVGLFQLPAVPEFLLSRAGFQLLRQALTSTSRAGTFSKSDLERYAIEWARPGRLNAMLNYYRALVRRPRKTLGKIVPPTLILWGRRDHALDVELATASLRKCSSGELSVHDDASHWLHIEEPDWVNARLLNFLGWAAA